ncbi:MAG: histidinol dehydrogenase [Bacteroidales bacterium]
MDRILFPKRESWEGLCKRPVLNVANLDKPVEEILLRVKSAGDKALVEYAALFDRVDISAIKVTERELKESASSISSELKQAVELARKNIEKFHQQQVIFEKPVETLPGIKCWRRSVPFDIVGLYIPGGSAPLFSTVLMLAIPAKIAGCGRVILCTPPGTGGKVNPLILYTASLTGIKEIYKTGGAQAIAAMAYGTETIPAVSKIFGPGNQYVMKAKELVLAEGVAIDMPAGPSEVLIIADGKADPSYLAADLLSQAEHGPDSQVVLLTNSMELMTAVKRELDDQLPKLPRKSIAGHALLNSISVLFRDLEECMEFSNLYAPEHLIINTVNARSLADNVINAGSVFIGKYSCESAGDYASGTNHTLPTNGYAKAFSGISVESFIRKISFQELNRKGLENIGPAIELMAGAENLAGHANAVKVRLKS